MLNSINHIGIAVKDIEIAIETYSKIFDLSNVHRETVLDQKVHVASFMIGNVMIELTQATDDSSTIAKFIEKRGEGIHHIAFSSDNVNDDLKRVSANGIDLINDTAKDGSHNMLIAFLHPKSTNGVLMEFCQNKD